MFRSAIYAQTKCSYNLSDFDRMSSSVKLLNVQKSNYTEGL